MTRRALPLAWLVLALLAAVFCVYWPGLGGGFIFDDRPNIGANAALHVTSLRWDAWVAAILSSPASNLPRPLAMLTFAVNHYFTGLDPWPMKLSNVVVHAINALLAFLLARTLLRIAFRDVAPRDSRIDAAALFVAAAWALNPINLMAVLYVVQRMESLSQSFVFLGLLLYLVGRLRMVDGQGGWVHVLSGLFGCAFLGAGAKESALLLPLYGLCVELCLLRFEASEPRDRTRLAWLYAASLVVPAVAALVLLWPNFYFSGNIPGRNFNTITRVLTEGRILVDYLAWTIYPAINQLSIYHDDYVASRSLLQPLSTLACLMLVVALIAAALLLRRRRPLAALGVLWFFAAHALTATVIPLELVFEHRNYFASFGVVLALADVLLVAPRASPRANWGVVAACVLVLMYGSATAVRAWEWRNPVSFAISEAGKHPNSPRAVYALGVALSNYRGLTPEHPIAVAAFHTFERARRLPDSTILPDQAALMLAARLKMPLDPDWWADMQRKLRSRAIGPQEEAALAALVNCSIEGDCRFPAQSMMATFDAAMANGGNPEVRNIAGNYLLNVLGREDLALYLWHQASVARPREAQYRINIIKLLIFMRRDQDAREEIADLRRLGRFGQYKAVADELEARRAAAHSEH